MTATPDQVPSDLTLEIGDNPTPERFLAAVKAFFGYVEELGNTLAPEGERPTWTVHVKEGSALIGVEPTPRTARNTLDLIYSRVEADIGRLVVGDIEGARLPDSVLKHLKSLSELTESPRKGPTEIRLWVRRKPVVMEPAVARTIREDWRSDYADFGTIEGRLDTIQDRGALQIQIRDVIFRQAVRCQIPDDMLPRVFESFRKRVEASGIIHFRRNGVPISIDVENITTLPDDSELPTAADVKGILKVSR